MFSHNTLEALAIYKTSISSKKKIRFFRRTALLHGQHCFLHGSPKYTNKNTLNQLLCAHRNVSCFVCVFFFLSHRYVWCLFFDEIPDFFLLLKLVFFSQLLQLLLKGKFYIRTWYIYCLHNNNNKCYSRSLPFSCKYYC